MEIRIKSCFAVGATQAKGTGPGMDCRDLALDMEPGSNIFDMLQQLPAIGPSEQFDDMMLHVFVNGRLEGFDYILQPGDVIDLHIPVSGG
jgi:molybdopterin converting factor small subunit